MAISYRWFFLATEYFLGDWHNFGESGQAFCVFWVGGGREPGSWVIITDDIGRVKQPKFDIIRTVTMISGVVPSFPYRKFL